MDSILTISAIVLAGGAVSGLVFCVFKLSREHDDNREAYLKIINLNEHLHATELELAQVRASRDRALELIQEKENERAREEIARKHCEGHREELLKEFARNGDPKAVAAGINDELAKLSQLGGVPSLPGTKTPGSEDRHD